MLQSNELPVLPLWINGRAFLTLASGFVDVQHSVSTIALRRIPLCGAAEVALAVEAAQGALSFWQRLTVAERIALLDKLADQLAAYASHFSGLICEEGTQDEAKAAAEVAASILELRSARAENAGRLIAAKNVTAVVGCRQSPLLGALRCAVPALVSGASLVLCPAPEAPSALLALAELSTRCGFPPGVVNVLYGGDATLGAMREAVGEHLLFS